MENNILQKENNELSLDVGKKQPETVVPYSSDEDYELQPKEILPEISSFEKYVVSIKRVTKVLKGGKKLSFSALVVIGDKKGNVGFALGKANEVPSAIEKAARKALKNIIKIPIVNTTIPHKIFGKLGATKILLIPARPGTGVIAGLTVRAIMEAAGVNDVLTKIIGSTNPANVVQATFQALKQLKTNEEIISLRQ